MPLLDKYGKPLVVEEKAAVEPWDGSIWKPIYSEASTGDWQRGIVTSGTSVLTFGTVYACVSLIANDVSKLKLRLLERSSTENGEIWSEIPSDLPIFIRPNGYQDTAQFIRSWVLSKLIHGNAYIWKARDQKSKKVIALHVLNAAKVRVRVTDDGAILYQVGSDNLSGVGDDGFAIPTDDIIHDLINPFYHPLCGISPLSAAALSATQGLEIQSSGKTFFKNNSRPAGIITIPERIKPEAADRLKKQWDEAYSGEKQGKVAVLSGGVDFKALSLTATDSQLIEQLKLSSEMACQVFHVPSFKVGVGSAPTYNNIEALNLAYYTDCLQKHIEDIENALKSGLDLPRNQCAEFRVDDLLRMDRDWET